MPLDLSRLVTGLLLGAGLSSALAGVCEARSPATRTPVLELYTSEGCSSCPPADRWLSTLKPAAARGLAVVQAFHVGYWDYIGWVDRFAVPAHTTRQRQVAAFNGQRGIYTPQLVRNGRDWRDYAAALGSREAAGAAIHVQQRAADAFVAQITPADGTGAWAAYWTVTEHGHSSKVQAGENAGELLQHDFVVRQYVPVGDSRGPATLTLRTLAADAKHPRQINLVVFDPRSGHTLQGLSLACPPA